MAILVMSRVIMIMIRTSMTKKEKKRPCGAPQTKYIPFLACPRT